VKGKDEFRHDWLGAKWYFTSAENRDKFARHPEKCAQQFGGYCAWWVSRDYTARIDLEAWRIVDGKLYLNYSRKVQKMWEAYVPGKIRLGTSMTPFDQTLVSQEVKAKHLKISIVPPLLLGLHYRAPTDLHREESS